MVVVYKTHDEENVMFQYHILKTFTAILFYSRIKDELKRFPSGVHVYSSELFPVYTF